MVWRGWFFGTEHVDISLDNVRWFQLNTENPSVEKGINKIEDQREDVHIGVYRNQSDIEQTVNERDPSIDDFYAKRDIYKKDTLDDLEYQELLKSLSPEEKKLLHKNLEFYELTFSNKGGLIMPLIIRFTMADGSDKLYRIPAEIWKINEKEVSKVFIFDQTITAVRLDPYLETADVDLENNCWPQQSFPTRYKLFKEKRTNENPMQRDRRARELGN